jgi:hypothetical protein
LDGHFDATIVDAEPTICGKLPQTKTQTKRDIWSGPNLSGHRKWWILNWLDGAPEEIRTPAPDS